MKFNFIDEIHGKQVVWARKTKIKALVLSFYRKYHIELPKLQGSQKQLIWANEIRDGFIAAMAKYNMQWQQMIDVASSDENIKAEYDKLMNASAKWWIENRQQQIFGLYTIKKSLHLCDDDGNILQF